ncbi:MAG: terminase small subunit [Hyphomicrobiales bacterium]|nr:terminase small subunit [Hyphomicrobiales bacterium]
MALNAKQRRFVDEYLVDLNATQAAIRSGYSKRTAEQQACRLLKNVKIAAEVGRLRADLATKAELQRSDLLAEYRKIAFQDIRRAFNENGSLKPIHELDDDTVAALAGIEVSEITVGETVVGHLKKIKLSDKRSALDSLAKFQGWNAPDKHELTGKDGGPIETSDVSGLTPVERAQRLAAILATRGTGGD